MAGNAANVAIGAASVCVNGSDIGYTTGGVKLQYQPTFVEVRADQSGGVIRRFKQEERLFVEFELIEITLQRIAEIFGYPNSNLFTGSGTGIGDCLYIGYASGCSIEEVEMVILSPAPNCCTREWTFPVAISVSEAQLNFQRDQEQRISARFEILKQSDGTFGKVCERTDCKLNCE